MKTHNHDKFKISLEAIRMVKYFIEFSIIYVATQIINLLYILLSENRPSLGY